MRKNSHSPSFDVSLLKKSGQSQYKLGVSRRLKHAWPQGSAFANNKSDMVWAFFHLASQVYSSCYNQVWVCASDLDL